MAHFRSLPSDSGASVPLGLSQHLDPLGCPDSASSRFGQSIVTGSCLPVHCRFVPVWFSHEVRRSSTVQATELLNVQRVTAVHESGIHDGHKQFGGKSNEHAHKSGPGNADDDEGMLVEKNRAANHAAVALKTILPTCVPQDDIRRAVWPAIPCRER